MRKDFLTKLIAGVKKREIKLLDAVVNDLCCNNIQTYAKEKIEKFHQIFSTNLPVILPFIFIFSLKAGRCLCPLL